MKIIDSHVYCLPERLRRADVKLPSSEAAILKAIHQHPDGEWVLALSGESKIEESMSRAGVLASALVAFPWNSLELCKENNDHILGLDSNKFYKVCSVQPKSSGALKEAERCLHAGAKGIKVNANWQDFHLEDDCLKEIMALIEDRRAYLLVHIDQAYKTERASAASLFNLVKRYPGTFVVAAHMGGLLGLYQSLENIGPHFKNLYFDTAISATLQMVDYYVSEKLEDKIIFGSDFPFNHCHDQLSLVSELRDGMTDKTPILEKIFSKNYLRLIGES